MGTDGRRVAVSSRTPVHPHHASHDRRTAMSVNIIVSYDGTANEDDAVALGRLLAGAGAQVALAYVRHTQEPDRDRETLAQNEAQELLERGAGVLGIPDAPRHVVTDRSTPEGLRALAESERAGLLVV